MFDDNIKLLYPAQRTSVRSHYAGFAEYKAGNNTKSNHSTNC